MDEKPVKILEISGASWMGGISVYPYIPTGGLFQQATNYDPFDKVGVFIPNRAPGAVDTDDINVSLRFMVSYSSGGTNFIVGFANSSKAFSINVTTEAATDVSAQISDIATIRGVTKYKGRVVYASDDSVKSNLLPLAIGSQVGLLSLSTAGHIMHVAPDRNLYITNKDKIARIVDVATVGSVNNSNSFLTFESDVITRGLTDDGQYLIIVGDTNTVTPSTTLENNRCFVAFWNMQSQNLTRIWSFTDSHISGVISQEDNVIVIGATHTYICNINSRPTILIPSTGNASLTQSSPQPGAILKRHNGTAIWGTGASMRGYGRLHLSLPLTLFTGYTVPVSTETILSVIDVSNPGGQFFSLWASTDGNKLFNFGSFSAEVASIATAGITFDQPYKFAFVKVILNDNLASGQAVDIEIKTGDGDQIVMKSTRGQANSFSFANFGAKKSHIFYPFPDTNDAGNSSETFEDLTDFKVINTGASIRKVEVWGYPIPPDQDNYL